MPSPFCHVAVMAGVCFWGVAKHGTSEVFTRAIEKIAKKVKFVVTNTVQFPCIWVKGLEIHVRESDDVEDKKIVELYWERSETAIIETQKRYGRYCHYIAYNILYSHEDAEECVNDTYIKTWNALPPHRPERLTAFLGKITRNMALDRYLSDRTKKRGGGQTEAVLDELAECVPDEKSSSCMADELALREAINGFLGLLPAQKRMIFLRRYWYMSSVKEIAEDYGLT